MPKQISKKIANSKDKTRQGRYEDKAEEVVTTKAFKRAVNEAMKEELEIKQCNEGPILIDQVQIGSTGWVAANVFALSPDNNAGPNIVQGVTASARIGNRIRINKATMDFVITCRPFDTDNNPTPKPVYVQMVVYRARETIAFPASTDTTIGAFWNNNASVSNIQGSLSDVTRNINNDLYIEYHREVYKLGNAIYGGTGTSAGAQSFTNNDFNYSVSRHIDVTKWVHKNVIFNDEFEPTTPKTLVMFNVVSADNTSAVVDRAYTEMIFQSTVWYTDA